MKKLAFLLVLVVAFALMGGVALAAGDNPHGPFAANTSVCAACHRAHTASAEYLLTSSNVTGMCISCHDGSAADCNVMGGAYYSDATNILVTGGTENSGVSGYNHADWGSTAYPLMGGGFSTVGTNSGTSGSTSKHMDPNNQAKTKFTYQWGQGTQGPGRSKISLDCIDCHTPHYGNNYRMLRQQPAGYGGVALTVPKAANITSTPLGTAYGTNPGRRYTEDTGRFNTILDLATGNSISKWCGLGCHDYYYRSAIRMGTGAINNGHTAGQSPPLTTRAASDAIGGAGSADLSVATNSIVPQYQLNVDWAVVVNGITYQAHRKSAVITDVLTLKSGTWPNTGVGAVKLGDGLAGSGQGSEVYWDFNNDGTPEMSFMHAVDVDLLYMPRNGSTAQQNLATNLQLGDPTYQPPVAIRSGDVWAATYTADRVMTCETCHRAHGTDVGMADRSAFVAGDRFISNTQMPYGASVQNPAVPVPPYNVTSPNQGSMLLRIENRGVCEHCHNMPNGF